MQGDKRKGRRVLQHVKKKGQQKATKPTRAPDKVCKLWFSNRLGLIASRLQACRLGVKPLRHRKLRGARKMDGLAGWLRCWMDGGWQMADGNW